MALMTGTRTSTHRLLGRLPKGTVVAHKTGSQWQRMCDLGIINLPNKKHAIVAVCTQNGQVTRSEVTIARIARKAYDLILAHHRRAASKGR